MFPEHWPLTQGIFISYLIYSLHSYVDVLEMPFVREDKGGEKPNFCFLETSLCICPHALFLSFDFNLIIVWIRSLALFASLLLPPPPSFFLFFEPESHYIVPGWLCRPDLPAFVS